MSKWISVKDRLPEKTGSYFTWKVLPPLEPYCTVTSFSVERHTWWSYTLQREVEHITHWMPLPEPPKEEA